MGSTGPGASKEIPEDVFCRSREFEELGGTQRESGWMRAVLPDHFRQRAVTSGLVLLATLGGAAGMWWAIDNVLIPSMASGPTASAGLAGMLVMLSKGLPIGLAVAGMIAAAWTLLGSRNFGILAVAGVLVGYPLSGMHASDLLTVAVLALVWLIPLLLLVANFK